MLPGSVRCAIAGVRTERERKYCNYHYSHEQTNDTHTLVGGALERMRAVIIMVSFVVQFGTRARVVFTGRYKLNEMHPACVFIVAPCVLTWK